MKNKYEYLNEVKMDFSVYETEYLTERERIKMKNAVKPKKNLRKYAAVGVCAAVLAVLGTAAYASGMIDGIINIISTGHNEFALIEEQNMTAEIPEIMRGLLFDANGNEITEFTGLPDEMKLYDSEGREIEDIGLYLNEKGITEFESENIKVYVHPENDSNDPLENARKEGYPIISDENEIAKYLSFKPKLPEYLPDGFEFYGASAYGKEYLFVYYVNEVGEFISVHERVINDETAYASGASKTLEETEIRGNKAVIADGSSIAWEENGISVEISGRGIIPKEELIKIAEKTE